jgi:hypothetical protein
MQSTINGYTYSSASLNKKGIVCYVVGYGGNISSYTPAIKQLQRLGYDIRIYEYTKTVFTLGNPEILLQIIDRITIEIEALSINYEEVVCMGVSLGSFIAFNVQKRISNAFYGVYADAGISVAHAIYTARVFRKVALAFTTNGYTEETLSKAWHLIDIKPKDPYKLATDKSLTIFTGLSDRVVNAKVAKTNMDIWNAHGTRVKFITKRGFGHLTMGIWFIRNAGKALKIAERFHIASQGKAL